MPINTRKIASQKGVTHEDITKLVRNNKDALQKMGKVKEYTGKMHTKGGDQDTHYYMLNEQQAAYLRKRNQGSRHDT